MLSFALLIRKVDSLYLNPFDLFKKEECLLIDVKLFIKNSQICKRFYKQR